MAVGGIITVGIGAFTDVGKIPTLGLVPDSFVVQVGCTVAVDLYRPGATSKQSYQPGVNATDAYRPGASEVQAGCG